MSDEFDVLVCKIYMDNITGDISIRAPNGGSKILYSSIITKNDWDELWDVLEKHLSMEFDPESGTWDIHIAEAESVE